MLSFLVDECVPRAVHDALAAAGYGVRLVRDELQGASDEQIVIRGRENGLVVLTEDRRFGFIAMGMGAPCSIIVLLLGDATPDDKALRLVSTLPGIVDSLADAVTVIGPTSIRRRPL